NLFGKGFVKSQKIRINAILDSALFVGMTIISVTGILLSNILFPSNLDLNFSLLFDIHNISSYICLGIMGLHTLMHLKYLFFGLKKMLQNFLYPQVVRVWSGFAAAFVLISILYTHFYSLQIDAEAALPLVPKIVVESSLPTTKSTPPPTVPPTAPPTAPPSVTKPVETASAVSPSSSEDTHLEESTVGETESELTEPTVSEQAAPAISLEEFLDGLRCDGCSRGCSLLSPRCGVGREQAATAEMEYQSTYLFQE
ncbi:MAG: DUF4405 domain-containing protein, partial [Oscillospiraceae bacterium]